MLRKLPFIAILVIGSASGAEDEAGSDLLPEPVQEVDPTVVDSREQGYQDPLEPLNRAVFTFNDAVYSHALVPLGRGYVLVTPDPVRQGISRVFNNIEEPVHAVNHTLQGDLSAAGGNVLRFLTNTTIGLLGILDPAESWLGLAGEETSLQETLMTYRVGQGMYLVIPFLGPSDLHGASARITQGLLLNPFQYLTDYPATFYLNTFDLFQEFAPNADNYVELKEEAEDPYVYFRNQYLQGVSRDQETLGNEQ